MEINDMDQTLDLKPCCLCGLIVDDILHGKFYEWGNIRVHYYCLLFSSAMQQNGADDEGILGFLEEDIMKEVNRGKRLRCSYCNVTSATIGCVVGSCRKVFHRPCGVANYALFQFFGEFKSFCSDHRPVQTYSSYPSKGKGKAAKTRDSLQDPSLAPSNNETFDCPICYESVTAAITNDILWAPCCKKRAWFHRLCIQKMALSSGYLFRCPLCNDENLFRTEMKTFGIHIPDEDASWEQVTNPYCELYERYGRCDALKCGSNNGRRYNGRMGGAWEILLCDSCGSQGTHRNCSQMELTDQKWLCQTCSTLVNEDTERLPEGVATCMERLQVGGASDDVRKLPSDDHATLSDSDDNRVRETLQERSGMRKLSKSLKVTKSAVQVNDDDEELDRPAVAAEVASTSCQEVEERREDERKGLKGFKIPKLKITSTSRPSRSKLGNAGPSSSSESEVATDEHTHKSKGKSRRRIMAFDSDSDDDGSSRSSQRKAEKQIENLKKKLSAMPSASSSEFKDAKRILKEAKKLLELSKKTVDSALEEKKKVEQRLGAVTTQLNAERQRSASLKKVLRIQGRNLAGSKFLNPDMYPTPWEDPIPYATPVRMPYQYHPPDVIPVRDQKDIKPYAPATICQPPRYTSYQPSVENPKLRAARKLNAETLNSAPLKTAVKTLYEVAFSQALSLPVVKDFERCDTGFFVRVMFSGKTHRGFGFTEVLAREAACELHVRDLIRTNMSVLTSGMEEGLVDSEPLIKRRRDDVGCESTGRLASASSEDSGVLDFPWTAIYGYAMKKYLDHIGLTENLHCQYPSDSQSLSDRRHNPSPYSQLGIGRVNVTQQPTLREDSVSANNPEPSFSCDSLSDIPTTTPDKGFRETTRLYRQFGTTLCNPTCHYLGQGLGNSDLIETSTNATKSLCVHDKVKVDRPVKFDNIHATSIDHDKKLRDSARLEPDVDRVLSFPENVTSIPSKVNFSRSSECVGKEFVNQSPSDSMTVQPQRLCGNVGGPGVHQEDDFLVNDGPSVPNLSSHGSDLGVHIEEESLDDHGVPDYLSSDVSSDSIDLSSETSDESLSLSEASSPLSSPTHSAKACTAVLKTKGLTESFGPAEDSLFARIRDFRAKTETDSADLTSETLDEAETISRREVSPAAVGVASELIKPPVISCSSCEKVGLEPVLQDSKSCLVGTVSSGEVSTDVPSISTDELFKPPLGSSYQNHDFAMESGILSRDGLSLEDPGASQTQLSEPPLGSANVKEEIAPKFGEDSAANTAVTLVGDGLFPKDPGASQAQFSVPPVSSAYLREENSTAHLKGTLLRDEESPTAPGSSIDQLFVPPDDRNQDIAEGLGFSRSKPIFMRGEQASKAQFPDHSSLKLKNCTSGTDLAEGSDSLHNSKSVNLGEKMQETSFQAPKTLEPGTRPLPARSLPSHAASMNPVALLNQTHPEVRYDVEELIAKGAVRVFIASVSVGDYFFVAEGPRIKEAKKLAAKKAIKQMYGILCSD